MAYLIVDATVVRTFYNGKGAALKETFIKRDGEEGASYFSAFFEEPHGLSEGDSATFSGNLSAKVNEYEKDGETRRNVDLTINNTRVKDLVYGEESAPAEPVVTATGF